MKLKRNLRAAALGFALAALAALSPLGIETAHAKTLVYCSPGSPLGFDPAAYPYTDSTTHDATVFPLYNRLLEFERGTTNVIPGLAESWSFSEDGGDITFHLRRGVKFHSTDYFTPTRDFNADDVIFSFNRQWKENHPWHGGFFLSRGKYGFMQGGISKIRRDDDYTVTFVFGVLFPPILSEFAWNSASIVSAEYAAQLQASYSKPNFKTQPIGTGPFQFVAYQPNTKIRYKAHPEYWNGVQAIDDLVFAITPNDLERYQQLMAGECHVAPYLNPANVEWLKQEPGITVLEQVGLDVSFLAYNTQMPPFNNVNVRKALNMSINKQAIVDKAFRGGAVAAKNLIPPPLWSYNDNTQDDPYDPAAARALLQREGVSGLRMKIWTPAEQLWGTSGYRPHSPNGRAIAELIKADFGAVGVKVEIVSYERSMYFDRSEISQNGAVLATLGEDGIDPYTLLVDFGCGEVDLFNLANWCNEEFSGLTRRAERTSDKAERTALYEEAQLIFKRDAPVATIVHEILFVPMSDKVIGYKVDPRGYHNFEGVDLAE